MGPENDLGGLRSSCPSVEEAQGEAAKSFPFNGSEGVAPVMLQVPAFAPANADKLRSLFILSGLKRSR